MGGRRWKVALVGALTWVIALSACGTGSMTRQQATSADPPAPWVMGYYVGYLRDSYPLDAVMWDALTHVVVGAAVPHPDGTLDDTFFLGDQGQNWAHSVVSAAHAHGRRAILMVGGAESREAFARAASDPHRGTLTENILRVVDTYSFDGVDIDWEPLTAADGEAIIGLAEGLRRARPELTLTAPIGPVNINAPQGSIFPFLPRMAQVFDRLNMMTYGMNGGWNGWGAWHSGALAGADPRTPMSVDSSFRAYRKAGIPAARLGIGIGFFGSCMRGVATPGEEVRVDQGAGEAGSPSYATIMSSYYRPEISRWEVRAQVPYLSDAHGFGPQRCTYLTYEDERSIAVKAEYLARQGLGGVILWNINQGHLPDRPEGERDPLLSAVRRSFLG